MGGAWPWYFLGGDPLLTRESSVNQNEPLEQTDDSLSTQNITSVFIVPNQQHNAMESSKEFPQEKHICSESFPIAMNGSVLGPVKSDLNANKTMP